MPVNIYYVHVVILMTLRTNHVWNLTEIFYENLRVDYVAPFVHYVTLYVGNF